MNYLQSHIVLASRVVKHGLSIIGKMWMRKWAPNLEFTCGAHFFWPLFLLIFILSLWFFFAKYEVFSLSPYWSPFRHRYFFEKDNFSPSVKNSFDKLTEIWYYDRTITRKIMFDWFYDKRRIIETLDLLLETQVKVIIMWCGTECIETLELFLCIDLLFHR